MQDHTTEFTQLELPLSDATETKVCSTCGIEKSLSEFYKGTRYKGGYRGQCKQCTLAKSGEYGKTPKGREISRASAKKWRLENLEKRKAYAQQYYEEKGREYQRWWNNGPGKEKRKEYRERTRSSESYREWEREYNMTRSVQIRAKAAVNNAVQAGKIPPVKSLKCVRCGTQSTEYHHHSYEPEFWLDVEPLCKMCHAKTYRKE